MSSIVTHSRANGGLPSSDRAGSPAAPREAVSQISDAELIRRFASTGDEPAFREVVRRYSPLVLSVALRTVHDRPSAEDVLQATFLVLIEKADTLDDASEVAAWLHGVAQRISRRLVDKRHRHREQPHRKEGGLMDSHTLTDPFERVCQTRDHDVLGEELQKLPVKFRSPLVLRYLEDLTNEQVAERLETTVNAVEGRLKRGKKELRRRLARRGVTLGAAMIVWNMTRQAVEAAPVADLATQIATTALGWQSLSSSTLPPTEPAVLLAQQEILTMSTLKLTIASTLVGTTLLATGLLVASSVASDGTTAASVDAPGERQTIDTAVADSNDEQPDQSVALPTTDPQRGATRLFTLKNISAELAYQTLQSLFSNESDAGAESEDSPSHTLTLQKESNSLIVSAQIEQIDEISELLQKMDWAVGDSIVNDAGRFLETFDEPVEQRPTGLDDSTEATLDATQTLVPSAATGRTTRSFMLKHVSATDAVKVLNHLYWGDADEQQAEQLRLIRDGHDEPTFHADASTNAVTVLANEEIMKEAEILLRRIESGKNRLPARETEPSHRFDLSKRTPEEEQLQRALRTPTDTGFDDIPFYNALFLLAERHEFQCYIDQTALAEVPVSLYDQPVTLNVSDVPVESVLDFMCRQVSSGAGEFDDSEVTHFVKEGLLVITTRDVAQETMEVRTYDLRSFVANTGNSPMNVQNVIEAIQLLTGEEAWAEQGGRGSFVQGINWLTVRQSPLVHRQIGKLLGQLLDAQEAMTPESP